MPLYTYRCNCGEQKNLFRRIADRHDPVDCVCGRAMKKTIAVGYAHSDVNVVTDDIDGIQRHITSSHELKKLCRENNVIEKFGKGWI